MNEELIRKEPAPVERAAAEKISAPQELTSNEQENSAVLLGSSHNLVVETNIHGSHDTVNVTVVDVTVDILGSIHHPALAEMTY